MRYIVELKIDVDVMHIDHPTKEEEEEFIMDNIWWIESTDCISLKDKVIKWIDYSELEFIDLINNNFDRLIAQEACLSWRTGWYWFSIVGNIYKMTLVKCNSWEDLHYFFADSDSYEFSIYDIDRSEIASKIYKSIAG